MAPRAADEAPCRLVVISASQIHWSRTQLGWAGGHWLLLQDSMNERELHAFRRALDGALPDRVGLRLVESGPMVVSDSAVTT